MTTPRPSCVKPLSILPGSATAFTHPPAPGVDSKPEPEPKLATPPMKTQQEESEAIDKPIVLVLTFLADDAATGTASGEEKEMNVMASETVQAIKYRMQREWGHLFNETRLLMNGKYLLDPLSLNDFINPAELAVASPRIHVSVEKTPAADASAEGVNLPAANKVLPPLSEAARKTSRRLILKPIEGAAPKKPDQEPAAADPSATSTSNNQTQTTAPVNNEAQTQTSSTTPPPPPPPTATAAASDEKKDAAPAAAAPAKSKSNEKSSKSCSLL